MVSSGQGGVTFSHSTPMHPQVGTVGMVGTLSMLMHI